MSDTNWNVAEQRCGAFAREYEMTPDSRVETVMETPTVVRGKVTDASYIANIVRIRVIHYWSEDKQEWWSSGYLDVSLVNPNTGNSYKTGWKAERISVSMGDELDNWRGSDGRRVIGADALISEWIENTKPKTIITVSETPR